MLTNSVETVNEYIVGDVEFIAVYFFAYIFLICYKTATLSVSFESEEDYDSVASMAEMK